MEDNTTTNLGQLKSLKHTKILVYVEDALEDLLVVTFTANGKLLQGILLDATKKSIPHGISLPPGDKKGDDNPSRTEGGDRLYSVSQRHTYIQGLENESPNAHGRPQQGSPLHPGPPRARRPFKSFKDRNVRTMRLRPRQVLCSKCRSICNENSENVQVQNSAKETCASLPLNNSSNSNTNNNNQNRLKPRQESVVHAVLPAPDPSPLPDSLPSLPIAPPATATIPLTTVSKDVANRMVLRKRRSVDSITTCEEDAVATATVVPAPPVIPVPASTLDKRPRREGMLPPEVTDAKLIITKTSPVIKISFGPQGQGTVLKISPRSHTSYKDEDEENGSRTSVGEGGKEQISDVEEGHLSNDDKIVFPFRSNDAFMKAPLLSRDPSAKAAKKALKKAKKEAHRKASTIMPLPPTPIHHHKSRHHKHKFKHKRRHRQDEEDDTNGMNRVPGTHSTTEYRARFQSLPHYQAVPTALASSPSRTVTTSGNPVTMVLPLADVVPDAGAAKEPRESLLDSWPLSEDSSNKSDITYSEIKKECLRQKLSISLKRLSAKAYMNCNPPCGHEDDSSSSTSSSCSMGSVESLLSGGSSLGNATVCAGSDSNSNSDPGDDVMPEFPENDTQGKVEKIKPLMMRISSHNVRSCTVGTGRTMTVGDIVWGKIHGFPWWPGRVLSITVSQRDNGILITQQAHVAWFGSSTSSYMSCSQLVPFLEYFKTRYNKKKRGPYKEAIKQATLAAQQVLSEMRSEPPLHEPP